MIKINKTSNSSMCLNKHLYSDLLILNNRFLIIAFLYRKM